MGDSIDLMTLQCRVEIEFPVVVDIANGYGIRIAIGIKQGKGAGCVTSDNLKSILF